MRVRIGSRLACIPSWIPYLGVLGAALLPAGSSVNAAPIPLFDAPYAVYSTDFFPVGIVTQDVNHDGVLDLVTSNFTSPTVSVLLGKADGEFEPQLASPAGSLPLGLATGLLDGDGDVDAVVTQFASRNVLALHGRGDGRFDVLGVASTASGPRSVVAARLDGDGLVDLAVACDSANVVTIMLGHGDGTFGVGSSVPVGSHPYTIVTGDFDEDGITDLAVTNSGSGSVSVLRGQGNGSFGPRVDLPVGNRPRGLAVSDLNGDGHLDLVAANSILSPYGTNTVSVLRGRGDGTFLAHVDVLAGKGPESVAVGDLDGEGHPDLIVGSYLGGIPNVSVLLAAPGGGFLPFRKSTTVSPVSGIALADFDSDGVLDFAVGGGSGVGVNHGNGDGTFGRNRVLLTGGHANHVAMADLDRDGHQDLVTIEDYYISVWLGHGDTSFDDPPNILQMDALTSVVVGDLNLDGWPDLVATSSDWGNGALQTFLGNGDGTFEYGPPIAFLENSLSAAIGDVTHDGVPDIVCGGYDHPVLFVLEGDGLGGFTQIRSLPGVPSYAQQVILVDLDEDGRLDAVSANEWSNTVQIFLDCEPPARTYSVNHPRGITAGDFDHDGRLDLVAGVNETFERRAVLFRGNGDGTLEAPGSDIPLGNSSYALIAADLNADGALDLASASAEGAVSVVLGTGDGAFHTPLQFGANTTPVWLTAGDLDEDGSLDLAVANANDGRTVTILLNTQNGLPTPIEVSFRNSSATATRIHLEWFASIERFASVFVERRDEAEVWRTLGEAVREGELLRYDDDDVRPGARYAYRVRIDSPSHPFVSEETWVEVPVALRFELVDLGPNPTRGPMVALLQTPVSGDVHAEVWDASGRRVASRSLGSLGSGTRRVSLDDFERLPGGIYWLRIVQGVRQVSRRIAVVR